MLLLAHKILYEKEKELKDEVAGLIAMQDRPLARNEGESALVLSSLGRFSLAVAFELEFSPLE